MYLGAAHKLSDRVNGDGFNLRDTKGKGGGMKQMKECLDPEITPIILSLTLSGLGGLQEPDRADTF